MGKGKYEKVTPKRIPWIFIILMVVLLAAMAMLLFVLKGYGDVPVQKQEDTADVATEAVAKNSNSIAIPGYEMLELEADSKKQTLCMPNPSQNRCYFRIELYLEDGTLLWESKLIEPGSTSKPMVLSKPLEKGMYPDAILRYSCYRMEKNLTPLNGAETKLTLWVK